MRRRTEMIPVTFQIVTEDPKTLDEVSRIEHSTKAPEGDYDYLNRVAQAVPGTLFAHAENPVFTTA